MILLKGLCFPEFANHLQTFLSDGHFGVVTLHNQIDQQHIVVTQTLGTVKTIGHLIPSIGSQIPIPQVRS